MAAVEHVSLDVARALGSIIDGWRPSVPTFTAVVSLTIDGAAISTDGATLRRRPQLVELSIDAELPSTVEQVKAVLSDGRLFCSQEHVTVCSPLPGWPSRLLIGCWSLTPSDVHPNLWIAPVLGTLDIGPANLSVFSERVSGAEFGYAAFRGRYDYYLLEVRRRGRARLLVDTRGAGEPTQEAFGADMLALQCALGAKFGVGRFEAAGPVSAPSYCARSFGRSARKSTRLARMVPRPSNGPYWPALFFECLSRFDRLSPEAKLYVPLGHYADALDDNLDGQAIRLHLALEAFASRILPEDEKRQLVRDRAAWRSWVASIEPELLRLAAPDAIDVLRGRVSAAANATTGDVVVRALAHLGAPLEPSVERAIKTELRGRNTVAHTAEMNGDAERDHARDATRIALLRTVMAALLARASGYDGPILGWEPFRDDDGSDENDRRSGVRVLSPGWWPTSIDARNAAARRFIADAGQHRLATESMCLGGSRD